MKKVTKGSKALELLKKGVDEVNDAVKVTLGPKGRNVVIQRSPVPQVTKDGVTVAKDLAFEDPVVDMGCQMIKEASKNTGDSAGDGTTTSTILAQAMIEAGLKNVAAGANPIDLKRGIDKATAKVVERIKEISTPVNNDFNIVEKVGVISANNDQEIGKMVAEVVKQVGKDGIVDIEESKSTKTYVDIVEGLEFDRGYISPHFVTNQSKATCEMKDALILVTDKTISTMDDLIPVIKRIQKENRPLVVIADDVINEAIGTLVYNKVKGVLPVVAVRAPGYGKVREMLLEDIATVTGGTVISEKTGQELSNDESAKKLGSAEKVIVGLNSTTIIGGSGEKEEIEARGQLIKTQIEEFDDNDEIMIDALKDRLAKINGGVGVIYVGGYSTAETKEKIDRMDDALSATRAAVEEGIVPGGGVVFIKAIESLANLKGDSEDENTGIDIVRKSLISPLIQIVENAGKGSGTGMVIVEKVKNGKKDYGYNARSEKFVNMIEDGVIDPAKVSRVSIQNAGSVAGNVLTTACTIHVERPKINQ